MLELALIHPVINHFTIALFTVAVLLDVVGKFSKNDKFHSAARYNLLFAGVALVLSVVTGFLAHANVPHSEEVHEIVEIHQLLAFVVLGIVLVLTAWRLKIKEGFPVKAARFYLFLGIVGVGFLFATSYLSGKMVFTHGVAVKMESVHSHGNGGHQHEEAVKEKTSTTDSVKQKKKTHRHSDGSVHEAN